MKQFLLLFAVLFVAIAVVSVFADVEGQEDGKDDKGNLCVWTRRLSQDIDGDEVKFQIKDIKTCQDDEDDVDVDDGDDGSTEGSDGSEEGEGEAEEQRELGDEDDDENQAEFKTKVKSDEIKIDAENEGQIETEVESEFVAIYDWDTEAGEALSTWTDFGEFDDFACTEDTSSISCTTSSTRSDEGPDVTVNSVVSVGSPGATAPSVKVSITLDGYTFEGTAAVLMDMDAECGDKKRDEEDEVDNDDDEEDIACAAGSFFSWKKSYDRTDADSGAVTSHPVTTQVVDGDTLFLFEGSAGASKVYWDPRVGTQGVAPRANAASSLTMSFFLVACALFAYFF